MTKHKSKIHHIEATNELGELDLFGNIIHRDVLLRDTFIEAPFSILDSRSGHWRNRRNSWKKIGIKSELGRKSDGKVGFSRGILYKQLGHSYHTGVSIFDPALTELLYKWFCPDGGTILDPFAGGSVRGVVANYLGYKYTGIDIRPEQVYSNIEQSVDIFKEKVKPLWICGDSKIVLKDIKNNSFDMLFTCPPYYNLERYSDIDGDISNMTYKDFLLAYKSILTDSVKKIKEGSFIVLVVGEVRDKKGNYIGFVPDTIKILMDAGCSFYNECIYIQGLAGACLVAGGQMEKSKKVRKVHQNVIVFKKNKENEASQ